MNKAQVAVVFLAGAAAGVGGKAFLTPTAFGETQRFQNAHVWVSRFSEAHEGHPSLPVYGGRVCAFVLVPEGGQRDACADLSEMDGGSASAFEAWLKSEGIAAPRPQ